MIMTSDRPQFESFEQMAEATAAGLIQVAAHRAFGLFRDKEFRRLASFDRLDQAEQDRVFNELVVAYVVGLRGQIFNLDFMRGLRKRFRTHVAGICYCQE
jgi:hypothetical protein